LSRGHSGFPKERIEVFCAGRVLVLDNFRKLSVHGAPAPQRGFGGGQDKGHAGAVRAFLDAVTRRGPSPIPFEEAVTVTRVTLALARAIRAGGGWIAWPPPPAPDPGEP
jgi:predicted dehydrogenase